jgi:DNA-binding GntR family transcriptional regulator
MNRVALVMRTAAVAKKRVATMVRRAANSAAVGPPGVNRIQEMVDVLRDRIARQHVAPGSKLLEQDLAEEFGAPRTAVREALSALEQRGLIERIPNRGAIVTRLDMAQVFHIYETREVLEGLCARLATRNAKPESWADLVRMFDGPMARYARESDFDAFLAGYELFRRRALAAAANPIVTQMLDSIYEKTQVLIRRIIILPGRAEVGEQAAAKGSRDGGAHFEDADAGQRRRADVLGVGVADHDAYRMYFWKRARNSMALRMLARRRRSAASSSPARMAASTARCSWRPTSARPGRMMMRRIRTWVFS